MKSIYTSKKEVLMRLKRIEGQIRGLQRMVEEEVSCPEILTQIAAVTSAIKKVGTHILQTYLEECLDKGRGKVENLKEVHKAISRYIDWA